MDDYGTSRHIIVSDFTIINDTFVGVSYHVDLSIYRMFYDNDNKIITCMAGPNVTTLIKFEIHDNKLIELFGYNIKNSLFDYISSKQ